MLEQQRFKWRFRRRWCRLVLVQVVQVTLQAQLQVKEIMEELVPAGSTTIMLVEVVVVLCCRW
jgi:hypothetical protein